MDNINLTNQLNVVNRKNIIQIILNDGRKTHGIDELYTYESPGGLKYTNPYHVSVKHTDQKYPTSPNTKFKEYVTDLANTIECFKESKLINLNQKIQKETMRKIIGILIC